MRHVVVGLLQAIQIRIYSIFYAERIELDGFFENMEQLRNVVPILTLHKDRDLFRHILIAN